MIEKDPNNKKPGELGAKLDSGKSPVFRGFLNYFPRAILSIAEVSEIGSKKYCWNGWETVDDGVNRYSDALVRHMCKDSSGEKYDIDTKLLHKAHVAWNALAVLELELRKQEKFAHTHDGEEGILIAKLHIPQPSPMRRNTCNFKDDPNCTPGL